MLFYGTRLKKNSVINAQFLSINLQVQKTLALVWTGEKGDVFKTLTTFYTILGFTISKRA